jgi:hypothetical protein
VTTGVFDLSETAAAANTSAVPVDFSTATNSSLPAPRGMPASVPAGELYYWTEAWQVGETETRAALARGEGRTFATARDAIRYLLSND